MRWKSHVRFGGRARETHQAERLAGRPGPTQPGVRRFRSRTRRREALAPTLPASPRPATTNTYRRFKLT